ncbi:LysR family transcriptional regulator [Synechococcus elongatus IITB4]|uniref:LysR family transcriptional regulator n=1 Tax=Synechococcus elongatus TaxID=32046 RepID=UPI0030D259D2
MNITQLQILAAVVETGNFSAAALQLDLSQPAVSRAIAALEDELGVVLLSRGRFGARPTRVGERVVQLAQRMLQLHDSMVHEVNLEKGLQGGHLRIASFRSAATHVLPPRLALFRQRCPGVSVSIIETDPQGVEQALREGKVDIGLVPLPRSEEFDTWEITRDEYVVLLPSHAHPSGQPLTWAQLSRYEFILYNYAECTTAVRQHWATAHQELKVAYEIKEDSTIVSMVAQGLGAAILPRLAAVPIPPEVAAHPLPIPLERVIGAAILASAMQVPSVFAFLDVLRQTAPEPRATG